MNSAPPDRGRDDRNPALDEIAAAWLCERDDGFAPGRAEAFAAWCAADPRHAAMVRRIEKTMAVLEIMPSVRRPLEARFGPLGAAPVATDNSFEAPARIAATSVLRPPTSGVWRPSSVLRRLSSGRRLAALAAALVVALSGWWFYSVRIAEQNHFMNAAAAPQRLVLRDGSTVHLNAHSELRVDFSAGTRRVQLSAGEAHFEVAHDSAHPFVVTAGGVAVRAIGTAFDVRLAASAVEVLVEEGRVEIAPVKPPPATTTAAPPPPAPQLVAGERARVARVDAIAPPQIEKVEAKELREALAWHRRTIVLADVPLEDVIACFNRRNAVQLVLADAELRGRRVGGVLALDQVEAFVALLERGGDITAERRGPEEIVLRRAR